jgi:hypothetical protein
MQDDVIVLTGIFISGSFLLLAENKKCRKANHETGQIPILSKTWVFDYWQYGIAFCRPIAEKMFL